jgi:hypothetical protein
VIEARLPLAEAAARLNTTAPAQCGSMASNSGCYLRQKCSKPNCAILYYYDSNYSFI